VALIFSKLIFRRHCSA